MAVVVLLTSDGPVMGKWWRAWYPKVEVGGVGDAVVHPREGVGGVLDHSTVLFQGDECGFETVVVVAHTQAIGPMRPDPVKPRGPAGARRVGDDGVRSGVESGVSGFGPGIETDPSDVRTGGGNIQGGDGHEGSPVKRWGVAARAAVGGVVRVAWRGSVVNLARRRGVVGLLGLVGLACLAVPEGVVAHSQSSCITESGIAAASVCASATLHQGVYHGEQNDPGASATCFAGFGSSGLGGWQNSDHLDSTSTIAAAVAAGLPQGYYCLNFGQPRRDGSCPNGTAPTGSQSDTSANPAHVVDHSSISTGTVCRNDDSSRAAASVRGLLTYNEGGNPEYRVQCQYRAAQACTAVSGYVGPSTGGGGGENPGAADALAASVQQGPEIPGSSPTRYCLAGQTPLLADGPLWVSTRCSVPGFTTDAACVLGGGRWNATRWQCVQNTIVPAVLSQESGEGVDTALVALFENLETFCAGCAGSGFAIDLCRRYRDSDKESDSGVGAVGAE